MYFKRIVLAKLSKSFNKDLLVKASRVGFNLVVWKSLAGLKIHLACFVYGNVFRDSLECIVLGR